MKQLSAIKFHVSGVEYTVKTEDVTPETSLNSYLRDKLHLTGTKRMCLEGGCGTCVVAVEENKPNGEKHVFSVNSCLVSIFSCHGWKVHSIEGIGNILNGFHQIQKVLADNNGTQCGFCSPGMVMNMYALHQSGPKTKADIENAFGGHICRCTGYRPIMQSFYTLASDKVTDIEDMHTIYDNCPKIHKSLKESFSFKLSGKSNWVKVYYLKDLMEVIRKCEVQYMLVAGNTAQGAYWPTSYPETYIDVSSVEKLIDHTFSETTLVLGANLTLTNVIAIFRQAAKTNLKFSYLKEAADHIDLIANTAVRNIGTLAGNLMIKHKNQPFQSDIFLILETIKAGITIVDEEDNELLKSPEEFLGVDMKKKIIRDIMLRGFDPAKYYYRSYKVMNRAQNTHAIVNGGFLFKLSTNGTVKSANMVYGGIAENFVHASATENIVKGLNLFDNSTLQKAFESLNQEVNPVIDPPEPSPQCRRQLAINLFYKYILSIAPQSKVSARNKSAGSILTRPVSSGIQDFTTDKSQYPLNQPIVKLEALAQTSGQAQYIMDKPDLPGQLHACFVTADAPPGSEILSIDAKEAFSKNGITAFYTAKDIPGVNSIMAVCFGLAPEELLCSKTVTYYSQPVGIVVAISHQIAMEGAKLVKVNVKRSTDKPLLDTREVLKAGRTDKITHQTAVIAKKTGKSTKNIEGEFNLSGQYHYHMETQTSFAVPTEEGLEVWAPTQWIAHTQFVVAQLLNMDSQKIDIIVKRLGGAYGAKIMRCNYVAAATALAAFKLQKPVRMWLPFHHNMSIIGKRQPFYCKYQVGVDDKGVVQTMTSDLYSDHGSAAGNEAIHSWIMDCFENAYNNDTWNFDIYMARTDTYPNTYARAPGTLEGLACIESIMEEVAYNLNLNPIDVRVANLDNTKYPKVLQYINDMRTKDNLDQRMAEVKAYNKANRWKKKGIALATMKFTMSLLGSYGTLISIYFQNGGVAISHGGVEMGQGINTKVAQVCAYKFGIPVNLVSIKSTNTLTSPNTFASGGSWTSEAICHSVIVACDELLARMDPIKKQNPNATWAQLVQMCHVANINLCASGYSYHDDKNIKDYPIFGICAAEVELDILTGQRIISRVDIIEDVGQSISPLVDVGQVEGAFIMGVGYHLTEELVLGPEGQLINNRTWNYTPPGVKDIPVDFRIKFPTDNPNPIGVLRSKATAEPPICLSVAIPLAIRNALASARSDADTAMSKWVPFDGPTTLEYTLLNSLNDYKQFIL